MAGGGYPDRDQWPRYWADIRHAGVVLLGAIVGAVLVVVIASPLLAGVDQPWRAACEALALGAVVALAVRVIGRR